MATRSVAVRLEAQVGPYVAGMKQAANATKDLSTSVARDAEKNQAAWNTVGAGMLAFGATAAVGVGMAVKKFADFDAQMSAVKAATHESAGAMAQLRDAALEAGARTAFSASEAAQGIEELAKAGVSTTSILNGGLNGALDLAAAGGLAVGDAAEIAATALTQFKLEGSQVPHVADLLAAAAGKAQGSVGDMGMALKQTGLVANQTGLTIEETTAGLASFASAGLIGSDAGTSFKSMLQRLTPQSVEAAELMDQLGISAYDAGGNFIGLEGFAGNLRASLMNLTPEQRNSAMATIFGSDAVRAAAVLYEQGADGIAKWTAEVNDQGYAAETAATRLDNLKGDIEALGGSLETALIGAGSGANGVLRELVQTATNGVNVFGALPSPVQTTATVIAAMAAAVGLAGGAFLIAVPKVVAFKAALGDTGEGTQRVAGGFGKMAGALAGPLGLALTVGAIGLGIYGAKRRETTEAVEEFTRAIQADSGAIGVNARALAAKKIEDAGALRSAQDLGFGLADVTDAVLGNRDALDRLRGIVGGYSDAATDAARNSTMYGGGLDEAAVAASNTAGKAEVLLGTVEKLAGETEGGVASAKRLAEATAIEGEVAIGAAGGVTALGDAQAAAAPKTAELTEAQKALGSALTSFVDPLGVYTDLLADKTEAERTEAEKSALVQNESVDKKITAVRREYDTRLATMRETKDVSDASIQNVEDQRDKTIEALEGTKKGWEDYSGKVTVTMGEVAAQLEADNTAHENWRANLVKIASLYGSEVAQILADKGKEGVRLTALYADGLTAESSRGAEALVRNARIGTDGASVELDRMIAIASSKGKLSAEALAEKLSIGVGEVERIAGKYTLGLASGINPILTALGKPPVIAGENGRLGGITRATGGPIWGAGTKTSDSIPAYLSNGEYVIRADSVDKYGQGFFDAVNAGRYAAGGFAGPGDVPRPTSTAPYGQPISTAGDRTMERAYGDAVDWIKTNAAPQSGPAPQLGSGIGWQAMIAALRTQFPGLPLNSGFRPGSITATGNPSYHGMGRAVDVPPRMDVNKWIAEKYGAQTKELIFSAAGATQLRNGQPHYYSGVTRSMHFDHNHWAMANGGVIGEPVVGMGLRSGSSYSFGERGPETVIPGRFAGGGWVRSGTGAAGPGAAAAGQPVQMIFADGMGWLRQFVSVVVDGQQQNLANSLVYGRA